MDRAEEGAGPEKTSVIPLMRGLDRRASVGLVYVRLDARLGRLLDNVARSNRLHENRPEKRRHGSHQAAIDCFNQAPVVHTWA
jgi:hypothetical protein